MARNEAETCDALITPKLQDSGWSQDNIRREHPITDGKIGVGGRGVCKKADYVLEFQGMKIAVIEAKAESKSVKDGVEQAKDYASLLEAPYAYSTNGKEIYEIDMLHKEFSERSIQEFPSPEELWNRVYKQGDQYDVKQKITQTPFENIAGRNPRYYQENAVNKTLNAIIDGKKRILLNLATGTGKTDIATHIISKLFRNKWSLQGMGNRRPRVLFLSDRNILSDQAQETFTSCFEPQAITRVNPQEIQRRDGVPTHASVFITIFQTLTGKEGNESHYKAWEKDFFDLVIIDECHRGGANEKSEWRDILEYFSPAAQIGLTATPKRDSNVDTYEYFGDPLYVYSLKQGIEDGFLTPFKVRNIATTIDSYTYEGEDDILDGEVQEGDSFQESDFNKKIEIKEREQARVRILLKEMTGNEKAIVFCANIYHAGLIRDLINEEKENESPSYCVRVTAADGSIGENHLKQFRDNENQIPTILTTSHKLSTGVDAKNIRYIVLMRPIHSMVEFKQIIGRGTRVYEGKNYFTIVDFVGASKLFDDPEWDGEPLNDITSRSVAVKESVDDILDGEAGMLQEIKMERQLIRIRLSPENAIDILHTIETKIYSEEGQPMNTKEFIEKFYSDAPHFFKDENDLRRIWSNRELRKKLIEQFKQKGYDSNNLNVLREIVNAEDCDIYDVLQRIVFAKKSMTRKERVAMRKNDILAGFNEKERQFMSYILDGYIDEGYRIFGNLTSHIKVRYHTIEDAKNEVGVDRIEDLQVYVEKIQEKLYAG